MATAVRTDEPHNLKVCTLNSDSLLKIVRILTDISKFAVESAVNVSRKGFTDGKKVYKIVQEGREKQPPSLSLDEKKKCEDPKAKELREAKTEEMLEHLNNIKQSSMASAKLVQGSELPREIPDEGIRGSNLLKTDKTRPFIRSRL